MKDDKFPDRHTYIGPSEAAIACGLSSYHDPIELWEWKTLRRARPETTPVMERGNWMEPQLLKRLREEFGMEITDNQLGLQDEDRPYFRGHVDGIITDYHYIGDGTPLEGITGPGVCEIKAPGSNMASKFNREGLSPDYIMQTQLYMYLTDTTWASVFYLDYDSNAMKQIDLERDDAFIKAALAVIDNFWQYVATDTKPPMETPPLSVPGPANDGFALVIADGEDGCSLGYDLLQATKEATEAEAKKKEFEDAIKKKMTETDHSQLQFGEEILFTWKEQERRTVEAKPLRAWVDSLVMAILHDRNDIVQTMCKHWTTEDDLFVKVSKSRPLRKKIL